MNGELLVIIILHGSILFQVIQEGCIGESHTRFGEIGGGLFQQNKLNQLCGQDQPEFVF